ncbi:growth hormone secretagogue receptor type 1 [Etheostoma cragini]|uniref:growth hormone secretagogue receptor type 1 n=1 Tax=Etheostoma cragini TaxID=417921 RepID=UPI00155E7811|nr:growth hormone secretagogue receptor type 1 [Etheostoma cragini]
MPWTGPQVELPAGGAEAMDQSNVDDHPFDGSLFPTSTLIPVTVICILILIIGVMGNTMTILIILHFKDMKTTTNLYLSSMAVSDLLIFLCLPFDLYRLWKYVPWLFGEVVCRFYHYIFEGCTSATILHIVALSVERYLAISFPLRSKGVLTRRRVQYIILALWGFALVSAAPSLFLVSVEYDNDTNPDYTTGQCKHTNYAIGSGQLYIMLWVSTTYFFCPMLCLTFLYGSIGYKLWRSKNDLQGPCTVVRERSHRQTVKILEELKQRVRAYATDCPAITWGKISEQHDSSAGSCTKTEVIREKGLHGNPSCCHAALCLASGAVSFSLLLPKPKASPTQSSLSSQSATACCESCSNEEPREFDDHLNMKA